MDPAVYTGLLGTAFTCLRSYEATGSQQDLLLSAEIVDTCAVVARASTRFFFIYFLLFFLEVQWVLILSINRHRF